MSYLTQSLPTKISRLKTSSAMSAMLTLSSIHPPIVISPGRDQAARHQNSTGQAFNAYRVPKRPRSARVRDVWLLNPHELELRPIAMLVKSKLLLLLPRHPHLHKNLANRIMIYIGIASARNARYHSRSFPIDQLDPLW